MLSFISEMSGLERLYVLCAAFGTILFVVRLALMFVGGDHGDADGGTEMSDAATGELHGLADSDISFKALSLQGITAFFMMFGLVGWAMIRQGNIPAFWSIVGGTAAGLATVWVMKKIFQMAGNLQSSGTINLQNAVGQEGRIYLTIHPGQTGKVQLAVQGRLLVLSAAAEGGIEIKTGQTVRVVRVVAETLIVEPVNA